MADFNELREQLQRARDTIERTRGELYAEDQALRRIEAEQAQLDRVFNARNREHVIRREQLEEARRNSEAKTRRLRESLPGLRGVEAGVLEEFGRVSDPRELINRLNDNFPFLMLPVRMETRWKDLDGRTQLWVRIYPDECAIDTFEPKLTPAEVDAARQFWIDWWRAGGNEGQRRGAWRALVAVSGSGRAAWIVESYRPLNIAAEPVKPSDGIVLVVASDPPLAGTEQTAAFDYFQEAYIAGDVPAARAALETAVGVERAAEIIAAYQPVNSTEPRVPADVPVQVAAIEFPPSETAAGKETNWSKAPVVRVLPDRFVLMGYHGTSVAFTEVGRPIPSPLVAGPDPSAKPEDQLKNDKGDIVVPDNMLWMTDFDRAVQVGMGFRIDVTADQARVGFDRLLAIGVRLSADEQPGRMLIEELFQHHQHTRKGFSFVRQGTPTNNVEDKPSGFSRTDDPDVSFDDYMKPREPLPGPDPWSAPFDGDLFADALGISRASVRTAHGYDWTDQTEARAMNVALWPATLGYWMDTLMQPVFKPETIEQTRAYFRNYVSGRGPIPAIRIGSQPYGILPATAFSRLRWLDRDRPGLTAAAGFVSNTQAYLRNLYGVLRKMDADWQDMSRQVSFVGKPGDAHQLLLDVVGLHPGSVEYHQRYSESLEHLFNLFNIGGFGGVLLAALIAAGYVQSGLQLLRALGRTEDSVPDILNKFFLTSQNLLKGPVVDVGESSETEGIRPSTTDNNNYIVWCMEAARTSLETLRKQDGFKDGKIPGALLYIYLRHALMLGYWETSLRLHLEADVALPAAVMREPAFVHVAQAAQAAPASESRFTHLYKADARITGDRSTLVSDHIPRVLAQSLPARYLREQLEALEYLKSLPTARLERLFAEHIDCCTYRLDAWQLGLVRYQLGLMRGRGFNGDDGSRGGLYVGAFGWLENVKSENKALRGAEIDPELDPIFKRESDPPLMRDLTNGGYVHAPSLNHAVTAAVLRNGYLANATPANPQTMAVNVSSDRVRLALSIIEGIRAGQSAGALLGYRFERGLHDRHNDAEVDQFIYRMRRAFPLRANQIPGTKKEEEGVSIEAIEARNVLDGVKLVEHIRRTGSKNYPFGVPLLINLPQPSGPQAAAINSEVDELLNLHDALADLALSEGVHQAVQGNYDRVAATMDAYSKGGFPPEPAVAQTPRTGIALTHRVGLQFEPGLPPSGTPRGQAEPAVNKWLGQVMPAQSDVFCRVDYTDPVTSAAVEIIVRLDDLGLEPLDLLYIVRPENEQAMTELDDRVFRRVAITIPPRPDAVMKISYLFKPASKISVFELASMVDSLRSICLRSRPLRATDIRLQTEAKEGQDQIHVDPLRIGQVRTAMNNSKLACEAFAAALKTRLDNVDNQRAQIIADIDTSIDAMVELLATGALLAIPQTGWGTLYDSRRQIFTGVLDKVREVVSRWEVRLAEFDQLLIDYANLPGTAMDEERFELIRSAERLISTQPINPAPALPDDFRDDVAAKRAPFATRLGLLRSDVIARNTASLADMLGQLRPLLPLKDFDLVDMSLDETDQQIITLATDLMKRAGHLATEADKRVKAADGLVTKGSLVDAAKALLGDDFQVVPEFSLTPDQGDEWEKALNATTSGELLRYLTGPPIEMPFPVDHWLYGAARVRPKLAGFEKLTMLAEALSNHDLRLEPIQLPSQPDDRWLALEYPPTQKISGDKLLYTAHYSTVFQKAARQCGLLIDEWTEVIPGEGETTGITFNYDRPNCEAPQVMLLVTPASASGEWQWQDLVDAVNETLEMAKKRAVEPVHSDNTAYPRFLPATAMAVTLYPISIAANLAVNNNVLAQVQR
jgi:hypothetical protein